MCYYKGLKVDTLLYGFDIEYLFLNIRGKSVGESIDLLITCGDDGKTEVSVTVPIDIQVTKSEEHTTEIEIGDGWTVKMNILLLASSLIIILVTMRTRLKNHSVLSSCIEMVYNDEEMFACI